MKTDFLRSKALRIAAIIVVVLLVIRFDAALARDAGSVALAQEPPGEVPTLTDALGLLAAGFSGAIVSFLLERTGWFDGLSAKLKWWLVLGLTVGLPVVAQLLLMFVPPEVWGQLEPIWQALALGFVSWLGSQVTHRLDQVAVAAVLAFRKWKE